MALLVTVHAALVGTDMLRGLYVAATVALAVTPVIALIVRVRAARRPAGDGRQVARRAEPVPAGPVNVRHP
jgi:hypothetical protein